MTSEFKDEEMFQSVPVTQLSGYISWMDDLRPEEYESYDYQMMSLNQISQRKEYVQGIYTPTSVAVASKNRYMNVLPSEATRVKLQSVKGGPDADYINANFVKGILPGSHVTYVATQAPVPGSIEDFWTMIWEQNAKLVVMLTDEKEQGRQKADKYWPDEGNAVYGRISVKAMDLNKTSNLKTRHFEISDGKETRTIQHVQYTSWPDHGVPKDLSTIHELFKQFRASRDAPVPAVVHCSAGIGRTGSFILIDTVLDYIASFKDSKDIPKINLFATLLKMRQSRPGSVQTAEQLVFCFKFLLYCVQHGLLGVKKYAQVPFPGH